MIAEPAELVPKIIQPQIDANIEEITVGINFGWEPPFRAFKFGGDRFFEAPEIPSTEHQASGRNQE